MDSNRLEKEIQLLLDSEEKARSRPKKGLARWLVTLALVGGLGFGGYRWWHSSNLAANPTNIQPNDTANRSGRGRGGGRGSGGGRPAVITVAAHKTDMPVYLRGLGTAAASNTVTVRSRVDGQLTHVAFRE